jgi:hypothetical protein
MRQNGPFCYTSLKRVTRVTVIGIFCLCDGDWSQATVLGIMVWRKSVVIVAYAAELRYGTASAWLTSRPYAPLLFFWLTTNKLLASNKPAGIHERTSFLPLHLVLTPWVSFANGLSPIDFGLLSSFLLRPYRPRLSRQISSP